MLFYISLFLLVITFISTVYKKSVANKEKEFGTLAIHRSEKSKNFMWVLVIIIIPFLLIKLFILIESSEISLTNSQNDVLYNSLQNVKDKLVYTKTKNENNELIYFSRK